MRRREEESREVIKLANIYVKEGGRVLGKRRREKVIACKGRKGD